MEPHNIFIITVIISVISSTGVSQSLTQNNSKSEVKKEEIQKYETQNIKLDSNIFFGDIFANSMRDFIPFSDGNANCTRDGRYFITEFNNQNTWAVKMYDSSAKYPGGILTGEVTELGNFDQCTSVSYKPLGIRSAYAVVNITFHLAGSDPTGPLDFVDAHRSRSLRNSLLAGPETVLWAVCVPDSCAEDDVRQSVERALVPAFSRINITANVDVPPALYTTESTTMEYSDGAMLVYGITIITVTMAVAGTLYELLTNDSKSAKNGFLSKCLISYSIIKNMENLMEDAKNKDFAIINGLKVMGIIGVIIGHRVALDLGTPSFSPEFLDHIYNDFWLGFLKTSVIVEIFFVVSGFLTYIIIENHLQKGKRFQFFYFLTYRLVRIFPTYVTVMLIFVFVLPYIGNGPLWKLIVYPEAEFCRKNWWTNILFINNYVNTYEMCMFHTWYLACDMHFFIVGTFLTYITYRWKKVGFCIFSILFVLSVYFPAKYIFDQKIWGVFPYFRSNMKSLRNTDYFHLLYIKSHFRITTYLIGIAGAYVYLKIKHSKFKFSTNNRIVGCAMCILVNTICVTSITGILYLPSVSYNAWDHILYFTFERIIYASTIAYFLVVGSLTNLGFISSMFESKFCTVVARLSYVGFLVHLCGQLHSIGQIRQPQYGNFWMLFWKLNADFATTVAYAVPLNLLIEAPCRKIFNHVMNLILNEENSRSDSSNNEIIIGLKNKAVVSKFQEV